MVNATAPPPLPSALRRIWTNSTVPFLPSGTLAVWTSFLPFHVPIPMQPAPDPEIEQVLIPPSPFFVGM